MEGVMGLIKEPLGNQEISSLSVTDRFNSQYTVALLIGMSALVTAKHYLGDMVSCYCPPHFTDSMVEYTNAVCWTTNTYYLPFEAARIPRNETVKDQGRIGYYQWVTLIFLFQATLFYIPRPLWRILNKKSGISVSSITDAAVRYQTQTDYEAKEKTMTYMVRHMKRYLDRLHRNFTNSCGLRRILKSNGNYLFVAYIFVKILYIVNIGVQLYLLNEFLGMEYHMYGVEVVAKMWHGQDWTKSERFPRVTLCDFKIRNLGNIHRYTVQCSLPVNLFNEILFIVFWFWLLLVGALSVASLLIWLWTSIYTPTQKRNIKRLLVAKEKISLSAADGTNEDTWGDNDDKKCVSRFVDEYVRKDGCFLLKMVTRNTNEVVASNLVAGLWDFYRKEKCPTRRSSICGKDESQV